MFDKVQGQWPEFEKRDLLIWGILSVALAAAAPFKTDFLSFPLRMIYWPIMIGLAMGLSALLRVLVKRLALNHVIFDVLVGTVFTMIYVPLIWVITDALLGFASVTIDELLDLSGDILIFSIGVSILRGYLDRRPVDVEEEITPEPQPRARLFERFDAPETAQIVRLTVNDHYVEVVLDTGAVERLLMRLRDAVAEVEVLNGYYTHRSHWVNHAFVETSFREQGRDFLRLTNGDVAPVSRTFKQALIDLGYSF